MSYELRPFIGISDFNFGLTQSQIKKMGGEAALIEVDNIMGEVRERRLGMIFKYRKKKLSVINISKHVEIIFNGYSIFPECDPIKDLSKYDTPIEGKNGSILFRDLGICYSGFKKKIPEGKLLIVFSKEMLSFYDIYINA